MEPWPVVRKLQSIYALFFTRSFLYCDRYGLPFPSTSRMCITFTLFGKKIRKEKIGANFSHLLNLLQLYSWLSLFSIDRIYGYTLILGLSLYLHAMLLCVTGYPKTALWQCWIWCNWRAEQIETEACTSLWYCWLLFLYPMA